MAEFCRNVSETHTCFKEIFLYTPAVLSSYIKHEFSAQVKKINKKICRYVSVHVQERRNRTRSSLKQSIHITYLFVVISTRKAQVYTSDSNLSRLSLSLFIKL